MPNKITILMYHDIRDFDQTRFPKRYEQKSFIRWSLFDKQIKFIKENFAVIDFEELKSVIHSGVIDKNYAILTFDDGLRDHYEVARRLDKEKISGCFFVPVEPVVERKIMKTIKIQFMIAERDNYELKKEILNYIPKSQRDLVWDKYSISRWKDNYWLPEQVFISNFLRSYSDEELTAKISDELFAKYVCKDESWLANDLYLNRQQIQDMLNMGMTIGGHGYTSNNLLNMSNDKIKDEIDKNLDFLNRLKIDKYYFSYPNGGYNEFAQNYLKSKGFEFSVATMNEEIASLNNLDIFALPRLDAAQKLIV